VKGKRGRKEGSKEGKSKGGIGGENQAGGGGGGGLWEECFNIVTVEVRFATVCSPNSRPCIV